MEGALDLGVRVDVTVNCCGSCCDCDGGLCEWKLTDVVVVMIVLSF